MRKPPFEKKKIMTETLGEYLQGARAALRLSRAQVQRLTHIPERYLQSLEEENYQRLPATIYVKGFLKSLAGVYQVPADILVAQFEKERQIHQSLQDGPMLGPRSSRVNVSRLVITPTTLTLAGIAVGVMASIGYLLWQVWSVAAPPLLEVLYPLTDLAITQRNMLLRGRTERGSQIILNGQYIPVDETGEFHEVVNLVQGANNLLVRSENKFGRSTELRRTVVVLGEAGAATTSTPASLGATISLIVKISAANTWIKAVADGAVIYDAEAVAPTELRLNARRDLILSSGNAGNTTIVYNGLDLGIVGRKGEVLSNIHFTAK